MASDTAASAAESDGQARKVVDIRVADEGLTQRLTLTDGSQIYGRVESKEADAIVFRSVSGVAITVTPSDILDLRVVAGRIVSGEFLPVDSHNTRLLFAPTARSLRRGEGYVGFYEAVLPFVQVGVTDRFSMGGGTPLFFGGGGSRPLWLTPKLQVLAHEKAQAAIGVIHFHFDDVDGGIGYGVTTLGPAEKATTLGVGYAYSSEDGGSPILMIGGEYRATRRIKWITENWIWRGGNGFVSGGIRFLGERLSADVGLVVPLVDEPFAFPLVSFAWSF
jgi:hypothetical protein